MFMMLATSGFDRSPSPGEIEVSIVIPCLNEVDTVAKCVGKAVSWLNARAINGEVILSDNGSTDGSIESAERAGARIVRVAKKGYGSALMQGIECALGKYVIMGDADDSYDFSRLDGFLEKLRSGSELVQGCRLRAGGRESDAERNAGSPSLVGQSDV
jgi:glycosyltransferase involved in cell wall biosynthesis